MINKSLSEFGAELFEPYLDKVTVTIWRGNSTRMFKGSYHYCECIMEDHCYKMHMVLLRKKYGVPLPETCFIIGNYPEPELRYGAVIRRNGERQRSISH